MYQAPIQILTFLQQDPDRQGEGRPGRPRSELARADLVEAIPADQGAVSVAATQAVSPLLGAASYRHAVKQLLTSVVREICTLRSVGAGVRATVPGHPVGNQQWLSLPRSH